MRGETEIRLTPKEFELLSLLVRHFDRVLTHRAILKAIWGPNAVEQPEHLWTLIAQLRKKIEPDPAASTISVERTVGRLPVLRCPILTDFLRHFSVRTQPVISKLGRGA